MTREPARPDRPDNLFAPVPGDHGAHGRFDRRSRDEVRSASSALVRGGLMLTAVLGAGVVAAAVRWGAQHR